MRTREDSWIPTGKWSQSRSTIPRFQHSTPDKAPAHAQPRITFVELVGSALILTALQWYLVAFRCSVFEDPLKREVVYVKTEGAALNDFRRKAVSDLVDPTRMVIDRLDQLKREAETGEVGEEHWEQSLKEARMRLLEIYRDSLSRRVPVQFAESHEAAQKTLHDANESAEALDWWRHARNEDDRKVALEQYSRLHDRAILTNKQTRAYYSSKDCMLGAKFDRSCIPDGDS